MIDANTLGVRVINRGPHVPAYESPYTREDNPPYPHAFEASARYVDCDADCLLAVGSSLQVYPIAAAVLRKDVGRWLTDNGWGHVTTFGGAEPGCARNATSTAP